jgi:toxin-antitoxin system PIN domain toxin
VTVYLLDVNVLLALSDPMHVHHEAAHRWFEEIGSRAWATCPLTENGYVRVASHPNYPNRPGDAGAVLELLRRFSALAGHVFWIEDASLRDMFPPGSVLSHVHVTDVYLVGLALAKGEKLATFDRRIPASLLPGGNNALEVIPA